MQLESSTIQVQDSVSYWSVKMTLNQNIGRSFWPGEKPAGNVNFSDFSRSYHYFEFFFLTTKLKCKTLKVSYAALIINIFGVSQVQRTFRLDSVLDVVFVVFSQYRQTLRAIISIIKRDDWLLDGCFENHKQSPIIIMSFIFNWMPNFGRKLSVNIFPLFITSSIRHNNKLCG